ncbi:MAG: exopolyphosphatase [Sinobacteraceae bacterium]|nr:exopolyphosphatase [Nevskiaceae bacterium]
MRVAARPVPEVLAAVDLGSNSFHLVVARYSHGQLVIIDRLREAVRLGAGVDAEGRLEREAMARALACLERFGQRLRDMRARDVRAVGTNALRKAHRKQAFLERARAALGHPIQIVSGREEARLIYSGVAHTMSRVEGRRLVVDIGGGSTELIIGAGLEPLELESTQMGCVGMTHQFFADGRVSAKRLARARVAARQELEPVKVMFLQRGWDQAAGSSGTVRAIGDALRELRPGSNSITPQGLQLLLDTLQAAGRVENLGLTSIDAERRAVFPAGVTILAAIFEVLGCERMEVADGAMREGLLWDMIGRFGHEDARERTVAAMQARYQIDRLQAGRVETTLRGFIDQVGETWQLDDPFAVQMLEWSARLHEIGLDVAHSRHHQHGAYLLENADMPGFTREEQRLLARLVGNHRRKLQIEGFAELLPPWEGRAIFLIVLLRLAVLLHRGRGNAPLPELQLLPRSRSLEIRFPVRWLKDHPLTVADLRQEIELLRAADFRLKVFSSRGNPVV